MRFLLFLCLTAQLTPQHVRRIIDGDTFILFAVDGMANEERVRVLSVDTPERGMAGYVEAARFTTDWLARGDFTLHACKRDSFGRLLAIVYRGSDTLAVALINAGHGVKAP